MLSILIVTCIVLTFAVGMALALTLVPQPHMSQADLDKYCFKDDDGAIVDCYPPWEMLLVVSRLLIMMAMTTPTTVLIATLLPLLLPDPQLSAVGLSTTADASPSGRVDKDSDPNQNQGGKTDGTR